MTALSELLAWGKKSEIMESRWKCGVELSCFHVVGCWDLWVIVYWEPAAVWIQAALWTYSR